MKIDVKELKESMTMEEQKTSKGYEVAVELDEAEGGIVLVIMKEGSALMIDKAGIENLSSEISKKDFDGDYSYKILDTDTSDLIKVIDTVDTDDIFEFTKEDIEYLTSLC